MNKDEICCCMITIVVRAQFGILSTTKFRRQVPANPSNLPSSSSSTLPLFLCLEKLINFVQHTQIFLSFNYSCRTMSCRRQRYANASWPTRRRSFNSSTDSRGRQRSKKKVCNFLETVFRLSSVKTFYSFISIECVNHLRLNLKKWDKKREITILCIFFASFNSIQIANRPPIFILHNEADQETWNEKPKIQLFTNLWDNKKNLLFSVSKKNWRRENTKLYLDKEIKYMIA